MKQGVLTFSGASLIVAGDGWFAIGNTAGSTNSLVSPGINVGIEMAYLAAELSRELLANFSTKTPRDAAREYEAFRHDFHFRDDRLFEIVAPFYWVTAINVIEEQYSDRFTSADVRWVIGAGNDDFLEFSRWFVTRVGRVRDGIAKRKRKYPDKFWGCHVAAMTTISPSSLGNLRIHRAIAAAPPPHAPTALSPSPIPRPPPFQMMLVQTSPSPNNNVPVRTNKKKSSRSARVDDDFSIDAMLEKVASVRISQSREHDLDMLTDDDVASELLPKHKNELLAALESSQRNVKLKAAVCLRKFVSVSNGDAVWEHVRQVVELNLVDRLADMLLEDDGILQYEVMWTLTNIAAGPHAYAARVMSSRALPVLVRLLLQSRGWKIRWQASWTLANLCGDSRSFRDEVLRRHPDLVDTLVKMTETGALLMESEGERQVAGSTLDKFAAWTLANLSRWPAEPDVPGGDAPVLLLPAFEFLMRQIERLNDRPDAAHLGDVLRCLKALFGDPNADGLRHILPDKRITDDIVDCLAICEDIGQEALVSALGVLVNISTSDDKNVAELLAKNADLVAYLGTFLGKDALKEYDASVVQHALMLFSNITASQPKSVKLIANLWPLVHRLARNKKIDGKTTREAAWCLATGVDSDTRRDPAWMVLLDDGLLETLCETLKMTAPDGPGEPAAVKNEDPQLFAKVAGAISSLVSKFGQKIDTPLVGRTFPVLWEVWWGVVGRAGMEGNAAPGVLERMHESWRRGYALVKGVLDAAPYMDRANVERKHQNEMLGLVQGFNALSVGRGSLPEYTVQLETEVLLLLNSFNIGD
ncbi:ARM repeat-containing protein [Gonapodya prolifera JEL478]|uniref:ARM repeat-containing protein n=1 Tax=Gonapodya prolifera (strain JEL478) TaxID=1344416 RepID=A0A139AN07_GONPJ|nr:ARM repeat-containing protein [Gonapodya prolifera JEL478]|eukprot:KXS18127.1 ARM repeat-containing protein [Gonapodya prolifera JEL478]